MAPVHVLYYFFSFICCRRSREINENNMKKFIEERKRLTMKHYRQVEQLKKLHQEQLEKFNKDSDKVGVFNLTLLKWLCPKMYFNPLPHNAAFQIIAVENIVR